MSKDFISVLLMAAEATKGELSATVVKTKKQNYSAVLDLEYKHDRLVTLPLNCLLNGQWV